MESKLGMSFKKSRSGALVFTFVLESPFLLCLLELVSTLVAELLPGLSLLPSPLPFSLSCERLKLLPFLILSTEVPLLLLSLSRDELLLVHSWRLSVEWLWSLGFLLCNGVRDLFLDLSDDDWMRPLLSDEDQEELRKQKCKCNVQWKSHCNISKQQKTAEIDTSWNKKFGLNLEYAVMWLCTWGNVERISHHCH